MTVFAARHQAVQPTGWRLCNRTFQPPLNQPNPSQAILVWCYDLCYDWVENVKVDYDNFHSDLYDILYVWYSYDNFHSDLYDISYVWYSTSNF